MIHRDKSLEETIKSIAEDAKLDPDAQLWERVQLRTLADKKPTRSIFKSLVVKLSSVAAILLCLVMGKTIIDKNDDFGINRYDLDHYITTDLTKLEDLSSEKEFSFEQVHQLTKAYRGDLKRESKRVLKFSN